MWNKNFRNRRYTSYLGYRMITKLKQNNIPFLKFWFVTIDDTCYIPKKYWKQGVWDVDNFKKFDFPLYEHENLHSNRQQDYGVYKWLFKYCVDKKFKWEEEKLAYALEIKVRKQLDIPINRQWYFDTIKKYNMSTDTETNTFLDGVV